MIAVAPTISWALVTTIPSSRTTTPHARESPSGPVMRRRTTAGLTWSFTAATVWSSGRPSAGTFGVTFTRSITRSGSTDRLPVSASTPPHSTAPTKAATRAIGHTGACPLGAGAVISGAESRPLTERRDLRRVAPEAVVGGRWWDATGGVVLAVVVHGHGRER